MDIITLNCLLQGSKINKAFSIVINRNETIVRLKEVIKEKKLKSYGFNAQKLKLWKVQIRIDSDEEIELHDVQLIQMGTISSYFTDELLCKYIHIIVRPPTPPVKFDLVCNLRLLKEGGTVEYVDKNCNLKATLCEGLLCTKDEKYSSFTEFIRAATGLKPNEKPNPFDFCNLKINNMTYEEVRDLIYKLRYSEQYDSESEGNLLVTYFFLVEIGLNFPVLHSNRN
ncbi:hypothetical protein Glove_311g19 [Diversispora epigaea]|uniref:Crinkler effector protein N-terminal domain-containing protein n=1 Tax=Diversispora epigaea TaxID=1348612 RepID=A0A397HYU5_9GLOM|nr:hypothetical protein Glove_311g19 [Diversispora epigaea]